MVGLKDNQKELKKQSKQAIENQAVLFRSSGVEKGHGRVETRRYEFYDLLEMEKADKWKMCQIKTLIKVSRERAELKSGRISREDSYYLSNEVGNYEELGEAVRLHWQVETNNHLRDVRLKEDRMRSKKKTVNRIMAGVRTLATALLQKTNCQNKKAQLENFSDDFDNLIIILKILNFL